ncbi:hypothetical protein F5Y00DRAFT_238809 [Daldinia vernicosa]|uniref:uncharacterized protein n=1 Tax=Daldinia vernicosa TaxID=114800 RepID=UPI002007C69F|nr:uncharacterized protein F5Y00DRAFT_238809 [Daldinia vernicosa]KAI0848301.1 hypothetical protein F5Y00DRAFT_238809 [Daldinia vernicosa]
MPPLGPSRSFARDMLSGLASKSLPSTATPTSTLPLHLARKIHDFASRTLLLPRLATDVSTVPEGYGRTASGPAPGAVAGIVLGSVAGFILLLWIIYWCVNLGSPAPGLEERSVSGVGGSSSVVSYRSRPRVRRHRHSHARSSQQYSPHRRKETVEITRRDRAVRRSRSSSPARVPEVDQIVVLEEHDRSRSRSRPRSRSRSRSISRPRPPPPPPRSDGDDEIVVLEEHTPPRRGSRGYRRRSSERRSGTQYRDVEYRRRSSSRRG